MPIRINLLAEAQDLEEQRRRDPVKRVLLGGALVVALILVWSSYLMAKTIIVKSELGTLDGNLNSRTNEYRQILDNQKRLGEGKHRLEELTRLATNRFLVGNLLDTLQRTTVDNVQLLRLKIEQTYSQTEEARPTDEHPVPKPATATERILLILNAKDSSPNPGDARSKFQDALFSSPYFQTALAKSAGFRLTSLGPPQSDPEGKPFVLFTLEARFPDKTR